MRPRVLSHRHVAVNTWVGITDEDWSKQLSARGSGKANFWQPSGRRSFRALVPGGSFLSKLHSPNHFIVGGGFFVRPVIGLLQVGERPEAGVGGE
jgi:hypothetical protein